MNFANPPDTARATGHPARARRMCPSEALHQGAQASPPEISVVARHRSCERWTMDISAEIGASALRDQPVSKDRLSFYISDGVFFFHVKGRFQGDSAQGVIRSGQSEKCLSFWTAKRIRGLDANLTAAEPAQTIKAVKPKQNEATRAGDGASIESRLRMLIDMLEQGLITPGEAKDKRVQILDEL